MCKKVSETLIYTQTSLDAERIIYQLGDNQGRIQGGGDWGDRPPKPTKVTFSP